MSLPMQGLVDRRSVVGEGSFGCSSAKVFQIRAFLQKASKLRSFDGYVSPVLAVFNSTSVSRSHEFNCRICR